VVNNQNYTKAMSAGIANNVYAPVFTFASSIGQLIVITYGLTLVAGGTLTFGILISYLAYVTRFYDPLRQMAQLWANLQSALAGWDRINEILVMENDLEVIPSTTSTGMALLEFKDVAFSYPGGKNVISNINFSLEKGKIYALVGPTGGGKTTTASLMARLYDPSSGTIFLDGKDIRSFTPDERTQKIGFILQEPFLFTGSVRDNIVYGNDELHDLSNEELTKLLKKEGLHELLERFDDGVATMVTASGDSISLGQRQLIAFIRAMLRHPELLILDEATANIDTVTEQLLEAVLAKLPKETTRVIIAHRLNTIENADEIFFVNGGTVTKAGSLKDAVQMLTDGKSVS
jgi:ATP-binding cassette subfamily B protein